jgi:hypothetical protein
MIYCLDVMITAVYVGHTTNFTNRKNNHKTKCNNPKDPKHNLYVYQYIRANGGWDNFDMIILEKCNCKDEDEATLLEHKWFIEKQATLNKNVPARTLTQYRIDNADKIKGYKQQYRIDNADKLKEYKQQYRIDNADKIKGYTQQYRIENADKIKERDAKYRIENIDRIKERDAKYRIENIDRINEKKRYNYHKNKLIKFYTDYHSSCGVCK